MLISTKQQQINKKSSHRANEGTKKSNSNSISDCSNFDNNSIYLI